MLLPNLSLPRRYLNKLIEKISQAVGAYIDPSRPFKDEMERFNRSGQIDSKTQTKIIAAVVEYLIDKDRE